MQDYESRFFTNLHENYQSNLYTDIFIVCADGSKLGAHKIILSSSCEYFKSMFECQLVEQKNNVINIKNFEAIVLKKLLNFIYSGKIDLDEETVQNILIASDYFGLNEVVDLCCAFLSNKLTPSNVIGIFEFSKQYGLKSLENIACLYLRLNFNKVLKNQEFLEMPFKTLRLCLSYNDLHINSEQQLFEASIDWMNHNIEERSEYFEEIRQLLRIPLLPLDFLKNYAAECQHSAIKYGLNKLISDVLECNHRPSLKSSNNLLSFCSIFRKIVGTSAYIIGGTKLEQWSDPETFKTIISFDSVIQRFTNTNNLVNLHQARSGHCIAVVDQKVYVFGGEKCIWLVDNVECFELHKASSEVISLMLSPRFMANACAVSNLIYLFGGQNESRIIVKKIDIFNTWTHTWHESKDLPSFVVPCHSQGVIYHEGLIYLMGGVNSFGDVEQQCISFNPVTEFFEILAPLKIPKAHFGIACIDDYIFISGGSSHSGSAVNSVERYSVSQNTWESMSPMNQIRINACMANLGEKLYVFGGEGYNHETLQKCTLSSVERYDPQQDEWSYVKDVECARSCACVAVL